LERGATKVSDHCVIAQLLADFRIPTVSPREFVTRCVWRWESDVVLLVALESCSSEDFPVRSSIVRGTVRTLAKFEVLEPAGDVPQTRLTWTQQPDMGGLLPKKAVNGAAVGQLMWVRMKPSPKALNLPR
jgi:hypothetical protein